MVYPALVPVSPALLRGLAGDARRAGPRRWRSRSGDFFGLRDFRPGDDPRDIHWRSSARRGVLLVREMRGRAMARRRRSCSTTIRARRGDAAAFERAVSLAAGLCVELSRRGFRVALVVRGGDVPRRRRAGAHRAHPAGAGGDRARRRPHARPAARHRRARAAGGGARAGRRGARRRAEDGVRFQVAHKLVTYLLVLAALAVAGERRRAAAASARCSWPRACCLFRSTAASRAALALDRAATPLRVAAGVLFAFSLWRVWRRLPEPDLAPIVRPGAGAPGLQAVLPPRQPRSHPHLRARRSCWC